MANRNGTAYGLTVLSPIIMEPWHPGLVPADLRRHDTELRRILSELGTGADSPFARLPSTHFARWVVWDDVYFSGYPAHEEHLKSAYLLFNSNFNGDLDDYLDSMVTEIPGVLDEIYQHCVGFPGIGKADDGSSPAMRAAGFRAYIRRCQVKTTFFFCDYPDASVADVRNALHAQKELAGFSADNQGRHGEDLQRSFQEFMELVGKGPATGPGTT